LTHPSFFEATATKEDRAAANVATAIAVGASAEAEASTTSEISSSNTTFLFPSRSSEILTAASLVPSWTEYMNSNTIRIHTKQKLVFL
jgi:hypothetical protein